MIGGALIVLVQKPNEKSLETKRFQGFCVAGVVRLELTARGFGGHVI